MKKILFILFVIGCIANSNAQVPSYVPADGLVAYYPLNGNANDESGNGYNLVNNNVTFDNDRFENQLSSAYFSGNGSELFLENSINQLSTVDPNQTFSFWFKSITPNNRYMFEYGSQGSHRYRFVMLPNDEIGISGEYQGCSSGRTINEAPELHSGWHHFVVSINSSNYTVYYDGEVLFSKAHSGFNCVDSINKLNIGNDINGGAKEYTNMIMDDIGLWNRALTDQEVTNLYNSDSSQDSNPCSEFSISTSSAEVYAGESISLAVSVEINTGIIEYNPIASTGGELNNFIFLGEFNNHFYYKFNTPTSWIEAEEISRANGGYLVCIDNQSENDFIWNSFEGNKWIGYYDSTGNEDNLWVNGQNTNYENWRSATGEPNTQPGEPYTHMSICFFGSAGNWVDLGNISNNGSCYSNNFPVMEVDPSLFSSTEIIWSTGDTTETISVTPTETTEYWVDVTTNGLTCREYVTINVTAPAAPTGDAEQTFCEASTVADLTATGENIQWYDSATGGNLLDSTTTLTDGQMVYASQTVNGFESTDRLEVSVSVQDITITATATEVCAGESVDLTVSSGLTAGTTACTSADLPANLQTGLVGYWPFCGNANDESGNGNNGSVNGATLTTDRFGNPDSAYSFDGVNDYISLNDSFFNGSSSVTQLTHSLWFNVSNYPTNGSYSFSTKEGYWRTISFRLTSSNKITFGGSQPSPQQYFNIHSPQNIVPINSWNNITVTYQNSTLKLYLNGSIVATETIALSSLNYSYLAAGNSTSTNLIGASHPVSPGLNGFVDGKIDDFALWNRALSETEVQQLAGAPSYTWSTGDTTETISVNPTETTEFWVDVTTNGVTCREYVTINVTAPVAPTGDPVQGGCSDFTVGSNNNAFTGENLQWYATPSGGNALPDSHLLVDGTYYYISQTVDGCESSDRFEFLYLAPDPTITIDNTVICEGDSTTVSVSSSPSQGSTTFLWNTGETSDNVTLSPTESTTFWVDQIYNSGAPENIQTVCRYFFGITVNAAPESPISDGNILECQTIAAQNLVATVSVNSGESIIWYDAVIGGNVVNEPSLSTAGTITYYAEAINDISGCVSLSRTAVSLTITEVDKPSGDAVQSFCENVIISDLSITGSNIQWYDVATGGGVLDPSLALSDGQVLYASQTENGCESISRQEVSVEIDIISDPILITTELVFCLAREATLADLEVDVQGFTLDWYDSFSGGNMLPMSTLLENGTSYYATLYDALSGCESLTRLEVVPTVIPCEVVIYNAISLNDNGINDYMVIENAEYFPDNSLEIYNRDGHLLYSQTEYGIGNNLFRGVANVSGIYAFTLSGNEPRLPTGSYLYVFKYFNPYEQQVFTLKGFLTINSN